MGAYGNICLCVGGAESYLSTEYDGVISNEDCTVRNKIAGSFSPHRLHPPAQLDPALASRRDGRSSRNEWAGLPAREPSVDF